jgi:hypothetical protein
MRKSSRLAGQKPEPISLPYDSPKKRRRIESAANMRLDFNESIVGSNRRGMSSILMGVIIDINQ